MSSQPLTRGDTCPVDGESVDIAVRDGDPGGLSVRADHVCVIGESHPTHGGKRVYHGLTSP